MAVLDFQQLFERLPSPHMVLDTDLKYVIVNPAYERATMHMAADLVGRHVFDVFPNDGDSGNRLEASFQHVLTTGEVDTLAYIRYEIPRPGDQGGGFEDRYWTAVHVPLKNADGAVTHIVQNTVDVTDIVRIQQAASLPFRSNFAETKLIERAREAEHAHQSLIAESADFRRIFQQAPGFIAVLAGPAHTFTFANDAYLRLVGGRAVVGKDLREELPEIAGQGFYELLDGVYETGIKQIGEGARIVLQSEVGQVPSERFIDFSYEAIKDRRGAINGVFVQGMDRTEAVRTLHHQRLLLDELNHRVKNTLASVQSIASQTLRSARDLPSAKKDFEARLLALSKAHNLLSARQWEDTELSTLISQELSAYGADRVTANGPVMTLNSKASIAIAMFIHELSSNAAKFGALSATEGRVTIDWRIVPGEDDDVLELEWAEAGGPPTGEPHHRGFGARMIDRVVAGELAGTYEPTFAPQGFSCRVRVPSRSYAKVGNAFAQ